MKMEKEINVLIIVLLVIVIVFLTVQIITMRQGVPAAVQTTTISPGQTGNPGSVTTQTIPAANPIAGWTTYTDGKNGFSFKYPAAFGANVWHPAQWPPLVTFTANGQDAVVAGCPNLHSAAEGVPVPTSGKTASGLPYSLYVGSDIGAGQLYSSYCYVFPLAQVSGSAVIDFVIQSHSACGFGTCGAYCGTQYEAECLNLNRKTAIEDPIRQMVSTFAAAAPAQTQTTVPMPDQTQTPVPAQTQPQMSAGKTVTLADNQTNVPLGVGDTFLLQLGDNYNWNITIIDLAVISRAMNIAVIRGAQGVYKANKIGGTDLTAAGDPVCRAATPPCAMASVAFNVHVIVQ